MLNIPDGQGVDPTAQETDQGLLAQAQLETLCAFGATTDPDIPAVARAMGQAYLESRASGNPATFQIANLIRETTAATPGIEDPEATMDEVARLVKFNVRVRYYAHVTTRELFTPPKRVLEDHWMEAIKNILMAAEANEVTPQTSDADKVLIHLAKSLGYRSQPDTSPISNELFTQALGQAVQETGTIDSGNTIFDKVKAQITTEAFKIVEKPLVTEGLEDIGKQALAQAKAVILGFYAKHEGPGIHSVMKEIGKRYMAELKIKLDYGKIDLNAIIKAVLDEYTGEDDITEESIKKQISKDTLTHISAATTSQAILGHQNTPDWQSYVVEAAKSIATKKHHTSKPSIGTLYVCKTLQAANSEITQDNLTNAIFTAVSYLRDKNGDDSDISGIIEREIIAKAEYHSKYIKKTPQEQLATNNRARLESCEAALTFFLGRPYLCSLGLIEDLKKHRLDANRYGTNEHKLETRGFPRAHFGFDPLAMHVGFGELDIPHPERYAFTRLKYGKQPLSTLTSLEGTMTTGLMKPLAMAATVPDDSEASLGTYMREAFTTLSMLKSIHQEASTVDVKGIGPLLEDLAELWDDPQVKQLKDHLLFQNLPKKQVQMVVDEKLMIYHLVKGLERLSGSSGITLTGSRDVEVIAERVLERVGEPKADVTLATSSLAHKIIPYIVKRAKELFSTDDYVKSLQACAVRSYDEAVTFDTEHPGVFRKKTLAALKKSSKAIVDLNQEALIKHHFPLGPRLDNRLPRAAGKFTPTGPYVAFWLSHSANDFETSIKKNSFFTDLTSEVARVANPDFLTTEKEEQAAIFSRTVISIMTQLRRLRQYGPLDGMSIDWFTKMVPGGNKSPVPGFAEVKSEVHVDDRLLYYHIVSGAFKLVEMPQGNPFSAEDRATALTKLRELEQPKDFYKFVLPALFQEAGKSLVRDEEPEALIPPNYPDPPTPPVAPAPRQPERPAEEPSTPIDLSTLQAFSGQHFRLKRKVAKRFKPESKIEAAITSCLQRASIPAGEIHANVSPKGGSIVCNKIERVHLERYVPAGTKATNLNCRAKVYLRRGKTLYELVCDIDANGNMTPQINGQPLILDIDRLSNETLIFFRNLRQIIAVGWEKILVTETRKQVLRTPKPQPTAPTTPNPGEARSRETYKQRARGGFALDSTPTTTSGRKGQRLERMRDKATTLMGLLTKDTPITINDLDALGNIALVKEEDLAAQSDRTVFVPIQDPDEAVTMLETVRSSKFSKGLDDLFVCIQPGYTRILPYTKGIPKHEGTTLVQRPHEVGNLSERRREHLEELGLILASGERTIEDAHKIEVDPREVKRVMLEMRDSTGALTAIPVVTEDLVLLKEGQITTEDGVSDGAARIEDPTAQIDVQYETVSIDDVQTQVATRVTAVIPDIQRNIGYSQGDMVSLGDLLRKTGNL